MLSYVQKHLKEIRTSRTCRGYHSPGELLSIEETDWYLTLMGELKTAGKTMKHNIDSVRTDLFLHRHIDFPVTRLKHVTDLESLANILKSESFQGRGDHEWLNFRDLSFWGADIHIDNIKNARQQDYDNVRHFRNAEQFQTEIMEQYATSPAFNNSASRYGNFRLSFPLYYLLSQYKTQHCGDDEPQIRVLGTDIYKQEIAHYIVVHGPDTNLFNHLPIVPLAEHSCKHLPFVYWMDGALYWSPESTSSSLKLKISEDGWQVRQPDLPRDSRRYQPYRKKRAYEPRCVWNELVIAFHLPPKGRLQIPKCNLMKNLTPCGVLQPFLGQDRSMKPRR